ncbi:hypothetical protein [Streptomyces sp. 184]|uniref:hypothetical protein n=1 Tax=Streptomyces sp. 184 TaxID=1827526 RepID=UPI003891B0CE
MEHTGDLTRQVTDRTTGPQRLDDVRYTRDDAGNITSQTTTSGQDAEQTTDRQYYATDALRRLTDCRFGGNEKQCLPRSWSCQGPELERK